MSLEILNNPLLRNITDFSPGNDSSDSFETIFPVQESPLELKQKTSRQIANTYYGGKPVTDGNGFQIYSDDPVFGGNIDEVVVYKSRFRQTIAGIDVVLFASKNGAFLLQRFMEALPNSNELILFLEIDDRYNHNTVMRAVAGAGLTNKKDMPFADILSFTRKHEVTVTPKSLRNLIEKGIYRNKVDFISWFLGLKDKSIGEIFSFFKQEALEGASVFFTQGIAENIVKLRISENGWNPNPKEGEYNPTFIPEVFYKEIKDFYEHKASQNPYENLAGQKKINAKIVKSFFESINEVKDGFNGLLNNAETLFPTFIYKRINKSLTFFFNQIDKLEKFIADPLTGMQHMVYRNYQIANAFLCGIYNSLVDIIAGIFSIIGFIFKAVAAMDKVNDRKVEYGEMFLELMEDLLEGILTFDYVEFFKECITFQLKTIVRLVKWVEKNLPKITLEKAAYYYGYIIGIIIDIIVETLLTSGTAAVARLAKSVESFVLNPLEKITKAITTAENALNRIIEFIRMILREFKKGSKEIFSKLEKILNEVFGFGEEVADHGLSPAEKTVKDNHKRIQEKINQKNKVFPDIVKGGDATKTFAENAGIKIEIFVSETKVFGQSTDYTCAATSLRMTLHDKDILLLEDELARALKTDANGASILDIPEALYFKRLEDQVTAIAEKDIKFSKLLEKLEDGDKAIVSLRTDEFKGHAVVLEKVEDGKVFLRDPLPMNQGASYSMKIEDFKEIFNRKAVIIKK
ncbi:MULTISPECIES: cysteine peptidase family C39 domain-containing protein [unclassified Chryseobacterium]|uniref:cysteine peptidase family C39 domain-containing protein n=1 Tax=unclassified Chryseobacterium TaxID=2593645 RepID=UPI002853686C|nr:cysteine peptidase family C39 domain-containing protein [Chryseobacterium sp. CFS7]MDR4891628.1 cysteine peptidase family C39 domain-containing protein [Chryseobacterium sp. CFS7]